VEFDNMRTSISKAVTLWVMMLLLLPFAALPVSTAWSPGDEEAIFGHTFAEEYWTNNSLFIEGTDANATLTASYVGVGEFSAFLIAFNEIETNNPLTPELIIPYQLFGMHFRTPADQEVFIGAIFAFLMVHNESYGNNQLPDVGHESAWYCVPVTGAGNPWNDVTPAVETIPATKIGNNHYRFGMRYTNLPVRVVAATGGGFLATLILPILTALISELTITYDIVIDDTGEVHAETLYTVGQVLRTKVLGLFEVPPSEFMNETLKLTAVHYMSIWASEYTLTGSTSGNTIAAPTDTLPMDENITIEVGNNDRAFDIGFGRQYTLWNESTTPDTQIGGEYTALNTLLGARASDFLLIAWQAPLSAFLFAHMAYGLSSQIQSTYTSPADLAAHAATAFHNSQWWYGVTFPDWNGSRIEQDPVYTAYTNLAIMPGEDEGGGVVALLLIVAGIVGVIWLIRRRR